MEIGCLWVILVILSVASAESDGLTDVIDIFDAEEKQNIVENVMPFDLPNMPNILLDLFEKSVNSREEEDNLIFSDLVNKAKKYSISSDIDIDKEFDKTELVPDQYRNIKLTVDKNGNIKVPNLFEVKDRPETIPLIKQFLKRRKERLLIQRQNATDHPKPEVVEATVRKVEPETEITQEEKDVAEEDSHTAFDFIKPANLSKSVEREVSIHEEKHVQVKKAQIPTEIDDYLNNLKVSEQVTPSRENKYINVERGPKTQQKAKKKKDIVNPTVPPTRAIENKVIERESNSQLKSIREKTLISQTDPTVTRATRRKHRIHLKKKISHKRNKHPEKANEAMYRENLNAENRQSYQDFDVSAFMEAATTDQENKFRFRKNDKIKNRDAYEYNEKEDHTETAYKVQLVVKNLDKDTAQSEFSKTMEAIPVTKAKTTKESQRSFGMLFHRILKNNEILLDDELAAFIKVNSVASSTDINNNNVTPFPHFRKSKKSRKRNYKNRHEPQYPNFQKVLTKSVTLNPSVSFVTKASTSESATSTPNNSKFLTDTEYYQHIRKKNKQLQISEKKEKEVILGNSNLREAVYHDEASLVTKSPKITDIRTKPDQTETIPSLVKTGTASRIQTINHKPSSAASSIPLASPEKHHQTRNKFPLTSFVESKVQTNTKKPEPIRLHENSKTDQNKPNFPVVYDAVPNWSEGFQPYLVTTSSPDHGTTKTYEYATSTSFVNVQLGRDNYPFVESLRVKQNSVPSPGIQSPPKQPISNIETLPIFQSSEYELKVSKNNKRDHTNIALHISELNTYNTEKEKTSYAENLFNNVMIKPKAENFTAAHSLVSKPFTYVQSTTLPPTVPPYIHPKSSPAPLHSYDAPVQLPLSASSSDILPQSSHHTKSKSLPPIHSSSLPPLVPEYHSSTPAPYHTSSQSPYYSSAPSYRPSFTTPHYSYTPQHYQTSTPSPYYSSTYPPYVPYQPQPLYASKAPSYYSVTASPHYSSRPPTYASLIKTPQYSTTKASYHYSSPIPTYSSTPAPFYASTPQSYYSPTPDQYNRYSYSQSLQHFEPGDYSPTYQQKTTQKPNILHYNYKYTTANPVIKPSLSKSKQDHLDDPFVEPSNIHEVIHPREPRQERNTIGDVLNQFREKTLISLQKDVSRVNPSQIINSEENNQNSKSNPTTKAPYSVYLGKFENASSSFLSNQRTTTPAPNIKFVSHHETTTSLPHPHRASPTPKLTNPFELFDKEWSKTIYEAESIDDGNFNEEDEIPISYVEPARKTSEIYIKHKADPVHEHKVESHVPIDKLFIYGSTTASPVLASPTPKLQNAFEFIDNSKPFEEYKSTEQLTKLSQYQFNPSWHTSEIYENYESRSEHDNAPQEILPELFNPNPNGRPVRFEETPFFYPEVQETVKLKRQIRWPDK